MRIVPLLALVIIITACSNNSSSQRARSLAAALQAVSPKTFGRGLVMAGAEADGATLVVRISDVPQHYSTKTEEELRSELTPAACNSDGFRRVIDGGNPLRFELLTTGGDSLPTVTIGQCQ